MTAAVCEAPVDSREVAPLDGTAVHEAGHAVVGILLGLPIAGVALRDDSRFVDRHLPLGICIVGRGPMRPLEAFSYPELPQMTLADLPRRDALPAYLMHLAAGRIAEAHAEGRALPPDFEGGWADRFVAEGLAGQALHRPPYSEPVHTFLGIIEKVAIGHVSRNWAWIERTARALATRGRLSGDEIKALRGTR